MNKQQALDLLLSKIEADKALDLAGALVHWDAATTGVPERSLEKRSAATGWLYGEQFRRFVAPDTLEAIEVLESVAGELTEYEQVMIRELGRDYRKLKAVPPAEYEAFCALTAEAENVWEAAREKSDFDMMLPYYEKIMDYQRRLCDWYGYEKHPYDALLDDYEKGATVEMLDTFFDALRNKIVPLVKKITQCGKQPKEVTGLFDIDKQRQLAPWLMSFTGYDSKRGKIGEVEHPFCSTITRCDVRITTKYHEDNLLSSIYSIIHECGHAIYEQNMDEEKDIYGIADDASMGIHESQSRLYENIIGRSPAFAERLLLKLQEKFDYFKDWDNEKLYRAVNIARPSLIRIEADELTYCLHVMVRYELEKDLITGKIKVAELPELWADKYEELIGLRPGSLAQGVLQDVHWSGGMVGYFPSYAIGSAYGAQMINTIKKTVDIDAAVRKEDLSPITNWLKENIHKNGKIYSPDELLRKSTGESFNPVYFADYLEEKFAKLYLE